MSGAGSALMGIGSARGEDRAVAGRRDGDLQPAARGVASTAPTACCCPSPAAPTSACSRSTRRPRWSHEAAHPDANIIFGAVIDDALGDEVRVTVIAAGFDGGMPEASRRGRRAAPHARSRRRPRRRPAPRPRPCAEQRQERRPGAVTAPSAGPSAPVRRAQQRPRGHSRQLRRRRPRRPGLPEVGPLLPYGRVYAARLTHGPVEPGLHRPARRGQRRALRLAQPGAGPGATTRRRWRRTTALRDGRLRARRRARAPGRAAARCTAARSWSVGPEGPASRRPRPPPGIGDGLVTTQPGVSPDASGPPTACRCCSPTTSSRRDRRRPRGRPGLVAGIVPATVAAMRDLGADADHRLGRARTSAAAATRCPQQMRDDVAAVEPASRATTSWGTPSLDVGAGVRAQLERDGVDGRRPVGLHPRVARPLLLPPRRASGPVARPASSGDAP